ncbi:hypothetical protein, partial [Shewanella sp. S1-58-MNA-CIBAN-0166]|uniref:hypothetical protein n=1 Tax=Shewanella sp. S1-58-MNA-CIBAN-0166 TaxID=3140467 RepID=UPI00332D0CBA
PVTPGVAGSSPVRSANYIEASSNDEAFLYLKLTNLARTDINSHKRCINLVGPTTFPVLLCIHPIYLDG